MISNKDMPAMPSSMIDTYLSDEDKTGSGRYIESNGLTKREIFAMHAMVGVMQDINFCQSHDEFDVAVIAVKQADALLDELERTK